MNLQSDRAADAGETTSDTVKLSQTLETTAFQILRAITGVNRRELSWRNTEAVQLGGTKTQGMGWAHNWMLLCETRSKRFPGRLSKRWKESLKLTGCEPSTEEKKENIKWTVLRKNNNSSRKKQHYKTSNKLVFLVKLTSSSTIFIFLVLWKLVKNQFN